MMTEVREEKQKSLKEEKEEQQIKMREYLRGKKVK
jgi:hypothetical protein